MSFNVAMLAMNVLILNANFAKVSTVKHSFVEPNKRVA
ncbi:hypothetical protein PALI_b0006 [Pseudoalteromonas aliena SW19]|uniref:Uncharacterized protein n=1 Tax=Pseudoalteromonas aliena SW19 TaxID=1314866 RepID=A0ABR9E3S0_9GAMM|nr:hypothetical protein [Pseudoalteromonas aliena SW19]